MSNNKIIYEGPSMLDGKPIVAIAVWSEKNTKTGGMVQTYILRQKIDPREANRTGQDYSICGNCPLRGTPTNKGKLAAGRRCYVNIAQGVLVVWKAYKRGVYDHATDHGQSLSKGRMVRLGSYGDPAAVPSIVWHRLLKGSAGHTGYSHQSKERQAEFDATIMMVSADSEKQAQEAWGKGQRTFRVLGPNDTINSKHEVLCPSPRVQCHSCGLCAGTGKKGKSVAIGYHGPNGIRKAWKDHAKMERATA